MGRQPRSKKPDQFGKGKVTPVQIAYIVDQYLSENHFTKTRTSFRSEASTLISKTPLQEGPKGLMTLGTIIAEYVSMKEAKLAVELEKKMMQQERFRVESLLQGMQNVMNAYNASSPSAAMSASSLPVSQYAGQILNVPPPNLRVPTVASSVSGEQTSFNTPMVVNSWSKKRQGSITATPAPTNVKKTCNRIPNKKLTDGASEQSTQQLATLQSSTSGLVDNLSRVQGSNVAKLMIHQTTSTVTPPRPLSAQSDENASPVDHSSSTNSSNCTIVSTKTVIVSPYKQATYYSVHQHCTSTSSPAKSDLQRSINSNRVKGRLNFDGADETTAIESSASESDNGNFLDLDLPVLDFDIADLLSDFGIYPEDLDASASHQQQQIV